MCTLLLKATEHFPRLIQIVPVNVWVLAKNFIGIQPLVHRVTSYKNGRYRPTVCSTPKCPRFAM